MSQIKEKDIKRILRPFLIAMNGHLFLPEDKIDEAKDALFSEFENILVYVKKTRDGFEELHIDYVGEKRVYKMCAYSIKHNRSSFDFHKS